MKSFTSHWKSCFTAPVSTEKRKGVKEADLYKKKVIYVAEHHPQHEATTLWMKGNPSRWNDTNTAVDETFVHVHPATNLSSSSATSLEFHVRYGKASPHCSFMMQTYSVVRKYLRDSRMEKNQKRCGERSNLTTHFVISIWQEGNAEINVLITRGTKKTKKKHQSSV